MRKEQNEANDKMAQKKTVMKEMEQSMRRSEDFRHFPFLSGDMIEQHRASLGAQLKSDM